MGCSLTRPTDWRSIGDYTAQVLNGKRIAVVLPAYNAAATLRGPSMSSTATSSTTSCSSTTPAPTTRSRRPTRPRLDPPRPNRGYGANQKTCYEQALGRGADIIVMVHPTTSTRRCSYRHWRR